MELENLLNEEIDYFINVTGAAGSRINICILIIQCDNSVDLAITLYKRYRR